MPPAMNALVCGQVVWESDDPQSLTGSYVRGLVEARLGLQSGDLGKPSRMPTNFVCYHFNARLSFTGVESIHSTNLHCAGMA
eukprot:SAG31_NODE_488_length_14964_cov_56.443458_16_plen_82_part_00